MMFRATYTAEGGWQGGLEPYGPLELLPSAQARALFFPRDVGSWL